MRIAFYLNLQGAGHCRRFEAVAKHLPDSFELAVVGMDGPPDIGNIGRPVKKVWVPGWGAESSVPYVQQQHSHDYHDFMVNHGANTAFTYEMVSFLNSWRPDLLVCDVGLEASILARLCGIPSIYARQHGERWDKGHTLAYKWACSLLAPFAEPMEQPDCPEWIREKTFYSGGFSRFSQVRKAANAPIDYSEAKPNVLVMTGFGGTEVSAEAITASATANPQWEWHALGTYKPRTHAQCENNLHYYGIVENVWPYLCYADLVIANAGHNSTMEIAAAQVPSVCIPAKRPFNEQRCKANILERENLSIVLNQWPQPSDWPQLMEKSKYLSLSRWEGLQDACAPMRAANHIAHVAESCAKPTEKGMEEGGRAELATQREQDVAIHVAA